MMMYMKIGVLLAGYLIAAIPFGYILYKLKGGKDIRQKGSGNTGASNVIRLAGKLVGVSTLVLDAGKGALAVALARWLIGDPVWEAAAALIALIAHCYPVYIGFKGGKGIATGCGAYGVLAPIPIILALAVFGIVILTSRIVAVASISAGLALPLLVLWWQPETPLLVSLIIGVILTISRHHDNIRKILSGEEEKIRGSTGR